MTSADDRRQLVAVRIDGDPGHRRGPIHLKLAVVEPVAGYGRTRTTKDVDGRIDDARDEVLAAVERVGRRNGMGDDWLNERPRRSCPGHRTNGRKRSTTARDWW